MPASLDIKYTLSHAPYMREASGCYTPFSSCTAWTLLDPLFPLLKTRFGNGRGGKGGFLQLVEKEARFRCLHEGLCGGEGGHRGRGLNLGGVTEENSFDVACGWHYYFSFKNRDTVAGKPKMLAHVSHTVEIIYKLFFCGPKTCCNFCRQIQNTDLKSAFLCSGCPHSPGRPKQNILIWSTVTLIIKCIECILFPDCFSTNVHTLSVTLVAEQREPSSESVYFTLWMCVDHKLNGLVKKTAQRVGQPIEENCFHWPSSEIITSTIHEKPDIEQRDITGRANLWDLDCKWPTFSRNYSNDVLRRYAWNLFQYSSYILWWEHILLSHII